MFMHDTCGPSSCSSSFFFYTCSTSGYGYIYSITNKNSYISKICVSLWIGRPKVGRVGGLHAPKLPASTIISYLVMIFEIW